MCHREGMYFQTFFAGILIEPTLQTTSYQISMTINITNHRDAPYKLAFWKTIKVEGKT